MWEQLQAKARQNSHRDSITGDMSHEDVRDRISSAVGTDGDGGILFDETIAAYASRRRTAEEYLISALVDSHQKAFRSYLIKPQWTTISSEAASKYFPGFLEMSHTDEPTQVDISQLAVTAELDEPLRVCT